MNEQEIDIKFNKFMSEKELSNKSLSNTHKQKKTYQRVRKVSDDFLNHNNPSFQYFWQVIEQQHEQLNQYIYDLDKKVKATYDQHQTKFVYAYHKHLDKVTKELKKLREMYDVNANKFSSDKAIIHLSKQCILFRQQAMRLHTQLEDALDEANIYKRKSEITQKQLKKTDETVKKYMLRVKQLECDKMKLSEKLAEKQNIISNSLSQYNKSFNNTSTLKEKHQINKDIQIIQDSQQITKNITNTNHTNKNNLNNIKINSSNKKLMPYKYRPMTTETSMTTRQKSKLKTKANSNYPYNSHNKLLMQNPEHFYNQSSIFKNQRILQLYPNNDAMPNDNHAGKKKNTKTHHRNHSIGNHNHPSTNILLQQHMSQSNQPENSVKFFGSNNNNNIDIQRQLQIFTLVMYQIQKTRSFLSQNNSNISELQIQSNNFIDLFTNDTDILKMMKIMFYHLEVTHKQNQKGSKFKAAMKFNSNNNNNSSSISNKNLAQLSAQLMQKLRNKTTIKTQGNEKFNNTYNDNKSKSLLEEQQRQLIYDCDNSKKSNNEKQQDCLKKMNQLFTQKKLFTKKQRNSKYINGLEINKK